MNTKQTRNRSGPLRLGLIIAFAYTLSANASIAITQANVATVLDFQDYTGTGFTETPSAGQLSSTAFGWTGHSDGDNTTFSGSFTTDGYAQGIRDGSGAGSFVAADTGSGNIAFGIQMTQGGSMRPGTVTVRFQNLTGASVDQIDLSSDLFYINDTERASRIIMSWSLDNSAYTTVGTAHQSAQSSDDLGWIQAPRSTSISTTLAHQEYFYVRFSSSEHGGGGAGRDALAFDNLSVTMIPEPSTLLLAALFLVSVPILRRRNRG